MGRRHGGKGARRNPSIRHRISANRVLGMAISLLILFRTWRGCAKLIKQKADVPALQWIHNLARAFRVSFVAYGVAGAALNMAYFD